MTTYLDVLGAAQESPPGVTALGIDFDLNTALKAAGELAQSGVNYYQQDKAEKESAASTRQKVAVAVEADKAATAAVATALLSAWTASVAPAGAAKTAAEDRAAADKAAADAALDAQDEAGAAVPPAGLVERTKAAKDMLAKATATWQVATAGSDVAKKKAAEFMVQAAQKTVAKADHSAIVKVPVGQPLPRPERSLTLRLSETVNKMRIGPIPGWGVGLGALGIVGTLVGVLLKRRG